MTLEARIETLTNSIDNLIEALKTETVKPKKTTEKAPVAQPVPVAVPVEAPVSAALLAQAAPVAQPTLVAAVPAPPFPMPSFAAPVAVPGQTQAPFTNETELLDYVLRRYTELEVSGPGKGNQFTGILQSFAIQEVGELQPAQYDAFYAAAELLK